MFCFVDVYKAAARRPESDAGTPESKLHRKYKSSARSYSENSHLSSLNRENGLGAKNGAGCQKWTGEPELISVHICPFNIERIQV